MCCLHIKILRKGIVFSIDVLQLVYQRLMTPPVFAPSTFSQNLLIAKSVGIHICAHLLMLWNIEQNISFKTCFVPHTSFTHCLSVFLISFYCVKKRANSEQKDSRNTTFCILWMKDVTKQTSGTRSPCNGCPASWIFGDCHSRRINNTSQTNYRQRCVLL